jgi:hypothetical protein
MGLAASNLGHVDVAAFGVRDLVVGGARLLEAYALDRAGVRHRVGVREVGRNAAGSRVALFESLLVRGLRAHAPLLVDVDRCQALRARIRAAWGTYAVFVG